MRVRALKPTKRDLGMASSSSSPSSIPWRTTATMALQAVARDAPARVSTAADAFLRRRVSLLLPPSPPRAPSCCKKWLPSASMEALQETVPSPESLCGEEEASERKQRPPWKQLTLAPEGLAHQRRIDGLRREEGDDPVNNPSFETNESNSGTGSPTLSEGRIPSHSSNGCREEDSVKALIPETNESNSGVASLALGGGRTPRHSSNGHREEDSVKALIFETDESSTGVASLTLGEGRNLNHSSNGCEGSDSVKTLIIKANESDTEVALLALAVGSSGSGGGDSDSRLQEGKVTTSERGEENSSEYRLRWNMLLSTGALEDAQISRFGSVADAHVLRRKGRLKEQDGLIEFIISMHATHSPLQVMEKMERWMREHFEDPKRSTIGRLVPSVGKFYTPLPLLRALQDYDEFASISRRKYVAPNFAEIRHVLNIAQVHAIAEQFSLVTFDADGTLYADGHHIEGDNKMIGLIVELLQHGANVAIVTAAGYPGDASRFEKRLAGLLAAFEDLQLPCEITSRFHVMGGECNYLLQVNSHYHLEFVEEELWKPMEILQWSETDIDNLLNSAERALTSAAARLRLPVDVIRKPRAVGVVPRVPTIYEVLEEMALTAQVQLVDAKLPFCAFNGGKDVFVDVGNKSIGLEALMNYLGKKPHETLHVGDRFTTSGNDSATRSKCPILWVANPEETAFYTRMLLRDIQSARLTPYIE